MTDTNADLEASRADWALSLDLRMPSDAVILRDGRTTAIVYSAYGLKPPSPARLLMSVDDAPAELAWVTLASHDDLNLRHLRGLLKDHEATEGETASLLNETYRRTEASVDPKRRAAMAALARAMDAPNLVTMERARLFHPGHLAWLAASDGGGATERAFVDGHPWLVVPAVTLYRAEVRAAAKEGPDAAATLVIARLAGTARGAGALMARMRGAMLPATWGDVTPRHVRGLLGMPADMFPPPLSPGAGEAERQGFIALLTLIPLLHALSGISGRPIASILGRKVDWSEMPVTLARRADIDETPDDYPDEWGAIIPADVMANVYDMVRAFATEVLSPALLARGDAWSGPYADASAHRNLVEAVDADPVMAGAVRVLLGQGTLGGLAETCAKWHARSDAISRLIAEISGDETPTGPMLFEDADLGGGHFMTCLNTSAALLDEGSLGRDANGALGLSHCVGGYGQEVTQGKTAIVSIRRRTDDGGYVRVSTAEIDYSGGKGRQPAFAVAQHRGPRNANPSEAVERLLSEGLARVRESFVAAMDGFVPDPKGWPATDVTVLRTGSWGRVRDLWAFALTKPQRTAGMDGILADAGLSGDRADAGPV